MDEGVWRRAARESWRLASGHPVWAVIFGALGAAMSATFVAPETSKVGERVQVAVVAFFVAVACGAALLYLAQLVAAPIRQRNEARAQLVARAAIEAPSVTEWNTWTHEQVVAATRARIVEGEALADEARHRLDPSTTKRRAEQWAADTSDDLRRYDQAWVVTFGSPNTLKEVNPADSEAVDAHVSDYVHRLKYLLGEVGP